MVGSFLSLPFLPCQKAPSAIRCIKTLTNLSDKVSPEVMSESTERHKVH